MQPVSPRRSRIEAVDLARGSALIAMAVYHFAWDLEFFGYAMPGMTAQGGWRVFARSIASSFLFLVGFSLFLAHARGVAWRPFARRIALVAAASGAITIATYIATPDGFIFFGILHHIAVASLLGLAFLRLPTLAVVAAALGVIALPLLWRHEFFSSWALVWTGLAPASPRSNDFVPVFPWFGAVLLGIATARLARSSGWTDRAAGIFMPHWTRPLQFAGQHSLVVYLVHQPVLIGALFLVAMFVPPSAAVQGAGFDLTCRQQCQETYEGAFCDIYCDCMRGALDRTGRMSTLFSQEETAEMTAWLQETAGQCTISAADETGALQ